MTTLVTTTPSDRWQNADKGPGPLLSHLSTAGLSLGCLIFIFLAGRDGLVNLYDRWRYEDEYGYGFLILLIVPLLLWGRRGVLLASTKTRWPGLAIVFIAQCCMVLAVLGESYFIQQIALITTLLGLGLVIFGAGASRILVPIAILLLLTVPLPYTLQAILTIKLQLLSTNIGVALIQILDIPVYVEGNIIDLGNYKLQVAEACSGLRYLLPLTCLGFLIAHFYKAAFWKKAIVVFSAAPLTIAINSFRIAATALLVRSFGTQMAEGFLHEFEGWVVFLVGVLLLGLEILALEKFRWSNIEIEPILSGSASRTYRTYPVEQFKLQLPLILTVLLCVATFGVITSITVAYSNMPIPKREQFVNFPAQLDRWTGHPGELEPGALNALKATDYYTGTFTEAPNNVPVDLFVAYYDSLNRGAAIHSPKVCLPGSGWEFAFFEERNFSDLTPGLAGTYNYTLIQKGEQKILMYYWYQQRKRYTANEFSMKYYLLVDNLFENRKDGALVRLYTPILAAEGNMGEAEANARLRSFAQSLFSKMPSYLPQ